MSKTTLNDFLKGGDNFKITKIDEHIDEFNKMMKAIHKEQEIAKRRKKNKRK